MGVDPRSTDLEARILACIDDLSTATDEYGALMATSVRAEVAFKSSWAGARRASEAKTARDRDSDADRATLVELEKRRDAETQVAVALEVIRTLRAILSGYQSLARYTEEQTR